MPFASALSTASDTVRAAKEAGQAVRANLGPDPDLVVAFYSPHHAANAAELGPELAERLGARAILGVVGESIVGGSREVEDQPAVAIWAAKWGDGVHLDAFHLNLEETHDGPTLFGYPDAMLEAELDPARSVMLCFGDPYTFPAVELFLPRMNEDHPGLPVMGGLASAPQGPNTPSLILNGEVKEQGAVGVLLRGDLRYRTVVSQGCRPIGRPLIITKGQDSIIEELGGMTPLHYLRGLLEEVSEADKGLMQRGLLIGLAFSEYREQFRQGDFLIRNLRGLDPRTGALAVTDRIRRGQTVQFQVRDAQSADADLREMLKAVRESGFTPGGGLLFSCNGRGTRMFPAPDHDAKAIQGELGKIALAGFFAAGEFGPVGGINFIHGFTASTVLFE